MELVSLAVQAPAADTMYGGLAPAVAGSPYPYGMRLHLTQEELEKLGYKDLPPAGTTCRIEAVGVVTRATSEDPDADGDCDYLCVDIQITEMGMEEEGAPEEDVDNDGERAGRMYGAKKP